MPTDRTEPRIIPCRLPPGMEIAIPPGGQLPPQQPMGTYGRKPLPPLPPLQPGLRRQISAHSVISAMSGASKTTASDSSRSRSRGRTTPSPSPSPFANEEIQQLENDINAILVQHTPAVTPRRLSENRSCSPHSRRAEPEIRRFAARRLSTPITMTSPRTLHRSSAKIRQITGLDLEYNGFKRAPVRPPRSPLGPDTEAPATPDNSGSVHRAEKQVSASEPARTLSMIDDYDEESDAESTEWDFSPSARRRIPSWIPASPVPPRVEISDFDEASPRRRDSEIGPLRSPGMHHFETLPARRNNHMEVSYVGAKDLYHATATSIANSTRRKMAEMAQDSVDATQDSGLSPKNSMSFATKVLQSGRRRPPVGINTKPQSPQCPGASTSSSTGKQSLGSSERPDVHAHSMDDDRLRVKYSDALSRVFRWSGEHRRDGTSAVDATPPPLPTTTTTTTPSESGSAGSPLAVPDLPSSKTISRRSVQVIAAQFKKTANSIVLSKDERRRENLRQSIRMIPEGNLL